MVVFAAVQKGNLFPVPIVVQAKGLVIIQIKDQHVAGNKPGQVHQLPTVELLQQKHRPLPISGQQPASLGKLLPQAVRMFIFAIQVAERRTHFGNLISFVLSAAEPRLDQFVL